MRLTKAYTENISTTETVGHVNTQRPYSCRSFIDGSPVISLFTGTITAARPRNETTAKAAPKGRLATLARRTAVRLTVSDKLTMRKSSASRCKINPNAMPMARTMSPKRDPVYRHTVSVAELIAVGRGGDLEGRMLSPKIGGRSGGSSALAGQRRLLHHHRHLRQPRRAPRSRHGTSC